jgi:NAD(P)-dependent dehydrogenase (short-subunit alcohol dehydrogenase family)
LRLAELGATVAVVDVNLDAAAEYGEQLTAASVQDELRDRAGSGMGIQADLTDPEAAARAIQNVLDRQQRLDILVIPAGGAVTPAARSAASVTPDEDFTTIVDVNMRTVVNCCRAAVPPMRDSGGGAIVTMASQSALWVTPDGSLAAYGMAKAAVVQYSRYLAAGLSLVHSPPRPPHLSRRRPYDAQPDLHLRTARRLLAPGSRLPSRPDRRRPTGAKQ